MQSIKRWGFGIILLLIGLFIISDYIYAGIQVPTGTDNKKQVEVKTPPAEPIENEKTPVSAEPVENDQPIAPPEPEEDPLESILILVNKEFSLPSDYVPQDLIEVNVRFVSNNASKKMMRKEAADALAELFQGADLDDIKLYGVSGYRSYERQSQIYNNKVAAAGQAIADQYVAYPGKSEHQTGLAMDVTNQDGVNKSLSRDFGQTPEGKWLKDNAHLYGFIIRYPLGKESITGYNYEPWHLRYVGKSAAQDIKAKELTLEEYIDLDSKDKRISLPGDDGEDATPVPVPNTEVKPSSADSTCGASPWKGRLLPGLIFFSKYTIVI